MNREFLNEAINLFDTSEKWDSFIELSNKRNEIKDTWYKSAKETINNFFLNDTVENWSFHSWGICDYKWYLEDFGKDSLCICMQWNYIHLWVNPTIYNHKKIEAFLNTEKYSTLLTFFRIDEMFQHGWNLAVETGNFYFDSPYDGNFTDEKLTWYAGNKTEEFVNQIAEKVNRIRKNPELTELLRELNEQCKL